MTITLQDQTETVKMNFLQSLVLLYLPCESFSCHDSGEKTLLVEVTQTTGSLTARVKLTVLDKSASAERTATSDDLSGLQVKNLIGKAFLETAETIFGYQSPWGIVTGIRPAKLAADYMKTLSKEQTKSVLVEQYHVLPERADICVRTAENELHLTKDLKDKTCSIYVSVPFCPSKCRYCSFVSSTTKRLLSMIPEYVTAMSQELKDIAETVKELGLSVSTVYFGGGTPAVLSADQLACLIDTVHTEFDLSSCKEFTIEAGRPDCITKEKLQAIHDGGVKRISINTQTANDEILKAVGRKHTFADYVTCMHWAKDIGIECINTDLIAGLPGESVTSFCEGIGKVIEQNPENITVHSFTLKKSSEYKMTSTATIDAASKAALDMVTFSAKTLLADGYEPYYMYRQKNTVGNLDNTGYAKPGTACLYNIYMMGEYHSVFAAGAGAVTKYVSQDRRRIERSFNPKYPYEYLDKEKFGGFDKNFARHFYENLY